MYHCDSHEMIQLIFTQEYPHPSFFIFCVSKFPPLFVRFCDSIFPPISRPPTYELSTVNHWNRVQWSKKRVTPPFVLYHCFESQYPHASFFIPTPLYFCILGVSKFPPLIFPFLWFPPHLNSARSIVNLEPWNPRSTDPKSAIRTHMQNSNPHLPKI